VEGFKKASFLKKILPDTSSEIGVSKSKWNVLRTCIGGDFFLKPVGLELSFFVNLELNFALFFLFFFLNCSIGLNTEVMIVEMEDRGSWKCINFL